MNIITLLKIANKNTNKLAMAEANYIKSLAVQSNEKYTFKLSFIKFYLLIWMFIAGSCGYKQGSLNANTPKRRKTIDKSNAIKKENLESSIFAKPPASMFGIKQKGNSSSISTKTKDSNNEFDPFEPPSLGLDSSPSEESNKNNNNWIS